MKLTELSKQKLVALALQFNVLSSVTEAASKSTSELVAALEKNGECVDLVHSVRS